MTAPKRIAFVDLYFCWPPHGGADVDLYHVVQGVQDLGYDVHLFVSSCEETFERGTLTPSELPFGATRIDFAQREITPRVLPGRIHDAVDAWGPDAVFLAHGFSLKPYVAAALAHYPTISRYYAYELTCPRDGRLFLDGETCPNSYLATPDVCRSCALDLMKGDIVQGRIAPRSEEYVAGRAYAPAYHQLVLKTLRGFDAIVASNGFHRRQMDLFNERVRVIPGGVDVASFACEPPADKARKVVLMTGRAEDPAKGMQTLLDAGERLAATRSDFEIRVTHSDYAIGNDWFKPVGWHDQEGIKRLYRESDICVFPPLWQEPFGLVAVEAMASGRPVCASRVGGLQDIVVDGETGFLFDAGDAAGLAERLAQLLDDAELRRRMGAVGRDRARTEYDWARVVRKYYGPLLEELTR